MPPLALPDYVASLLAGFAPWFTAPSFAYFCGFVWSFMVGEGKKTTTLVWQLHSGGRHFTNFARFLRCYRWDPASVAHQLVKLLLRHLPWPQDERGHVRLTVAVDDTLAAKTGRKLPAVAYHKDPNAGQGVGSFVWGHCWVAVGLVFWVGHCTVCFPLQAALYRRREQCPPAEFRTRLQLALELLERLPWPQNSHLTVLADGAYAARDFLRGVLRLGHQAITRLRMDARVFDPPPQQPRRRPGRPRLYGRRRSLRHMAAQRRGFRTVRRRVYGQRARRIRLAEALLIPHMVGRVCKIVIVQIATRPTVCLLCTDTALSAEDILALYARRFSIEMSFRELKQRCGFGHYQVRSLQAIQRHVQLSLLACSLLQLAGVELQQEPLAALVIDPWRRPAALLSLGQARRLLRLLAWRRSISVRSPQASTTAKKPASARCLHAARRKCA